jgi:hypothetical protein
MLQWTGSLIDGRTAHADQSRRCAPGIYATVIKKFDLLQRLGVNVIALKVAKPFRTITGLPLDLQGPCA